MARRSGPRPGDRCLTVRQPWATLIACGFKSVEFRKWRCEPGTRFWLHAGSGKAQCSPEALAELEEMGGEPLTYGAILCQVEVVRCAMPGDLYEWTLKVLQVLDEPVPAAGALGLWKWKAK